MRVLLPHSLRSLRLAVQYWKTIQKAGQKPAFRLYHTSVNTNRRYYRPQDASSLNLPATSHQCPPCHTRHPHNPIHPHPTHFHSQPHNALPQKRSPLQKPHRPLALHQYARLPQRPTPTPLHPPARVVPRWRHVRRFQAPSGDRQGRLQHQVRIDRLV